MARIKQRDAPDPETTGDSPFGGRVITMRDVARTAGVSQSTVSRVLSGAASAVPIADETRGRVMATARGLGYRPNPLARALRGAPTMLLGVIVRDITDPFFAGAIEAASVEASKSGYNVVLGQAHGRADEAIALWSVLEARHVDGIVLFGDVRDQPRLVSDLRDSHVPVVALWQGSRIAGIASVAVDNQAGIRAVLDHLVSLGHRRIGFIGGRRLGDIQEREEAFVEYMAGVRGSDSLGDGFVQHATNDPQAGVAALGRLLELPQPPTAVVAATDVLAFGALHGAHARGVAVPAELSITGFDDIALAAFSAPSLTTVRMPVAEMVAAGVQAVIGDVADADKRRRIHSVFQPSLVVRMSSGPAPPARVSR